MDIFRRSAYWLGLVLVSVLATVLDAVTGMLWGETGALAGVSWSLLGVVYALWACRRWGHMR